MPRGSKDKYTEQQKRKAAHIEESYEKKGVSPSEAQARAWATVNKQSGGGEGAGGAGRQIDPASKAARRQQSARRAVATQRGIPRPDRPLEAETKLELLAKAKARNIAGRSRMAKHELIDALRKTL